MTRSPLFHVLFVCTGNMCRSPLAEAILKEYLTKRGIWGISVSSAGIMAPANASTTTYALMTGVENGLELSEHRTRQISSQIVDEADLILVMERSHENYLMRYFPDVKEKMHLIKGFAQKKVNAEVVDPVGHDLDFYRNCYQELETEIHRILPVIEEMAREKG